MTKKSLKRIHGFTSHTFGKQQTSLRQRATVDLGTLPRRHATVELGTYSSPMTTSSWERKTIVPLSTHQRSTIPPIDKRFMGMENHWLYSQE